MVLKHRPTFRMKVFNWRRRRGEAIEIRATPPRRRFGPFEEGVQNEKAVENEQSVMDAITMSERCFLICSNGNGTGMRMYDQLEMSKRIFSDLCFSYIL